MEYNRYVVRRLLIGMLCILSVTPAWAQRDRSARILGADISFLPQLEARGIRFSVDGVQGDAVSILKAHGFNFVRLRIFVDPAADSGYSPGKGFCDLTHTLAMAKRVKAAGMGLLIDFHYSDTWADPGKQFKPHAWTKLDFRGLCQAVGDFTQKTLAALNAQGTPADMVQIGNEINHGILWPDGRISHPDTLAAFLKAGIAAARKADPGVRVMLHIADGGQNAESRSFLDAMLARGVDFDIIGESYYPQWHGTLEDLKNNLTDLATRYRQPVIVAEYTAHKKEVNDIVFSLPHDKGIGSFIWEPLNTWESIFDKQGAAKDSLLNLYPIIARTYHIR